MIKWKKGKQPSAALCCLLAIALWSFSLCQASAATWFPAPVLQSARVENGNYVLSWSQPSSPIGNPAGGYDIFIDGKDTNTTWRTTGTGRIITGLNTKVSHRFRIEARWTQARRARSSLSNELTVAAPSLYPAPVLNSAILQNGSYVLSWSLPAGTETPSGGFDIFIDGTNTNTTWRTTGTSRTITGLDTRTTHTFLVEARWMQADPDQYANSNAIVVQAAAGDTTAPKVAITNPSANTTLTAAQTLTIVASASDNVGVRKVDFYADGIFIGTDSTSPFSISQPVSAADNGTYSLTAIAFDSAGNMGSSAAIAVTVNINDQEYAAPVLNSAKLENDNYVLNWSLPTGMTETPSGGFDVIIDGVDTNTTWRTTGTSQTITGLDPNVSHTFLVEARWTQAEPDQYLRSNQLSVAAKDSVLPPQITLNWNPSNDSRVIGYRLYYKESSSGDPNYQKTPFNSTGLSEGDSPIDVGLNTSYTLNLPYKTTVFCFAATAYSSDGLESEYSNIVCTGN